MSSQALMPFTIKRDFSSAGASQTISIGRCDPVPRDSNDKAPLEMDDCWIRFPVSVHDDGMQAYFDVCVPNQNGDFTLSETETYRLLCHAIVQQLPHVAFEEAVESLTGMYAFYRDRPPLLEPPKIQSVKAKVTDSYYAPVYPVTED